jgi:amidase
MTSSSIDELGAMDATAQAELVRTRRVSPLELVDAAIARLERDNPALNAVLRLDLERARERANAAAVSSAPFAGVPTLLKDIGADEAGQSLWMGSRLLRDADSRADQDSHFLRKLLSAGFIPLGRTNMPEFAIVATTEPDAFGPTRNPWNTEHSAGGSSGGSAAAVAAGIVPVAHASDGGGSIRGPATMCGLLGLKPTRGRCSFGPGRGERWSSMSVEFMLTRSVRDCAALLDQLAGPMPGDPYYAPPPAEAYALTSKRAPQRLRIGMLGHGPRGVELDPACAAAVEATAKLLEQLGHTIESAYPKALDESDAPMLWAQLVAANIARMIESCTQLTGRPVTRDDIEPLTFTLAELGRTLTATQHLQALDRMHAYGRRLCDFFHDGFDVLLTPTQAAPPPRIGYLTSTPDEPLRAMLRSAPYGVFTLPFNMSGQPAISVPAGQTPAGLPLGVQLVSGYGREDVLLQLAAQLEQAQPWKTLAPLAARSSVAHRP